MSKSYWRKGFALLLTLSLVLSMAGIAAANISGAIYTTDVGGQTNQNSYDSKQDVYLNGGPQKIGAAGLPDGYYYCQVTASNGAVLGTSVGGAGAFIKVTGGAFEYSYHLWTYFSWTDSPNGVYKVWVSMNPSFPSSASKTDNFKVGYVPMGMLEVNKYHDLNVSGIWDPNEDPIDPWQVYVYQWVDGGRVALAGTFYAPLQLPVVPGNYRVVEAAGGDWWRATTPTTADVTVADQQTQTIDFANVQLGQLIVEKFNDENGDGIWDDGEPAMEWGITLSGPEWAMPHVTTTQYSAYVLPGQYTIVETTMAGWELTTGNSPATPTAVAGQTTTVTLGNMMVLEPECYSETAWAAAGSGQNRFVNKGNWATYVTYNVGSGPGTYDLYAGQHYRAGEIHVWVDGGFLYVEYELSGGEYKDGYVGTWTKITEAHLHVASSVAGIPSTKKTGPVPGQFAHHWTTEDDATETSVTFGPIDISGVGGNIVIAAHAVVWWCGFPPVEAETVLMALDTIETNTAGQATGLERAYANVTDSPGQAATVIEQLIQGINPGKAAEAPGRNK